MTGTAPPDDAMTARPNRRALAVLACCLAGLLLAVHVPPAIADEIEVIRLPDQVPEAAVATDEAPLELEEIVVTAQKVEQNLLDVPVAVSVVNGDRLRDFGVFGPEALENFVPNVELDIDQQAPSLGVRGFSTDSYNVGLDAAVGIIVDEIPIGRAEFIPDGLFDVGRVEVLRGPQGTLFGKNTIAGVVIFESQDPVDESGASLTVGGNGERRVEAAASIPLGWNLGARLAAVGWRDGGSVDNDFLDRRELESEQRAARLKLVWEPVDRLAIRLGSQRSDTATLYSPWQLYDADPEALEYARSKDPQTEDDPFDAHTSFDLPGFVNRDSRISHAIAEWRASDTLSVKGIVGHATLDADVLMDFDVSAADLVRVDVALDFSQRSAELRLLGRTHAWGRPLEFVGGLFGFEGDMTIVVDAALGDDIFEFGSSAAGREALGLPAIASLPPAPLPGPVHEDGLHQTFVQRSQARAVFGQLDWALSERLSVITGARVARGDKDALLTVVTRPQPAEASITATVASAENFSRELSRREREVSPKLALNLGLNRAWSTYLSWTRGYKSGGFNAISFQDESEDVSLTFEPERADSYELGIKGRPFGGSMRISTTLYRTDVSDMQVVSFNGVGFDVFNAARARLQGIEIDLSWLTPWSWLRIDGSLAVGRARYLRYPDGPVPQDDSAKQDLAGKTLPKAPTMTAALIPGVSLPLPGGLDFAGGIEISRRGDQFLELDLDAHSFQRAYTLIGGYISVGAANRTWRLTLRGENLGNTRALAFVADHNLYANSYFAAQVPLRSVSLSLSANWE